jgi:hypothetical protein
MSMSSVSLESRAWIASNLPEPWRVSLVTTSTARLCAPSAEISVRLRISLLVEPQV